MCFKFFFDIISVHPVNTGDTYIIELLNEDI